MLLRFRVILFFIAVSYSESVCPVNKKNYEIKNNDINYLLYTRENPTLHQVIIQDDMESVSSSSFSFDKSTKFIAHGRNGKPGDPVNTSIRDAFLSALDVNVFVVDWSSRGTGEYEDVVARVPQAGRDVAAFVTWLGQAGKNQTLKDTHLIGLSQGAHLVGIAGRHCGFEVDYITGLDPPRALWGNNTERIRPTDAHYVEIIHTNAGFIGLEDAVGDADFYPNRGRSMPGCAGDTTCSHLRSFHYFAESIDNQEFMAEECRSYEEMDLGQCANLSALHMGGSRVKQAKGIYYLETNSESPFAQGKKSFLEF